MGPILRAAKVIEAPDASIHVLVPAGPAYERLREPARCVSSPRRSRPISVARRPSSVELAEGAADAPRITQERVRQDRLSELIQKEPVLGRR
jgi:hypothetical protein